jgi:hypothetical protein
MIMIRGWYHNRNNGKRLLPIDQIAEACCISSREVKEWFAGKILQQESTGPYLVDAADVVGFLAKNSIPVPTSLLPPKTRKILFISRDEYQFQDKCEKFDQMCRFLSRDCNILVETSIAGRLADLSILTFCPNLVVIYLKDYNQETINTFNLLTNFPEQKTIFLVEDSIKNDLERDLKKLSQQHLVFNDSPPVEQFFPQLGLVFDN